MIHTTLEQHLRNQLVFQPKVREADTFFHFCIGNEYFQFIQNQYKQQFLKEFEDCPRHKKIEIMLVDLQNDFVIEGGSLYIKNSEKTVIFIMAFLDALLEIITEFPDLANLLTISTSQDAHQLLRKKDCHDLLILKQLGLNVELIYNLEFKEVNFDKDPSKDRYGAHCIVGTVGVDIVSTIEKRLQSLLELNVDIVKFAKMNFSGPRSGAKISLDTRLSQLSHEQSYFLEGTKAQSYQAHFASRQIALHKVIVCGVSGEICVQQAAIGIKEILGNKILVEIDECLVGNFGLPNRDALIMKRNNVGVKTLYGIPNFQDINII